MGKACVEAEPVRPLEAGQLSVLRLSDIWFGGPLSGLKIGVQFGVAVQG